MKYYDCKVCGRPCIGLPYDGEIYEKEVCTPECLDTLNTRKQYRLEQTACPFCENTDGNMIVWYSATVIHHACGKCMKHYVISRDIEDIKSLTGGAALQRRRNDK